MAGTELSESEDLRDTISTIVDGGEVEYVETDDDGASDGRVAVEEVDDDTPQQPDDTPGDGRVRDSLGRFVPKAKAGAGAPPEDGATLPSGPGLANQEGAPASAPQAVPAPQSWSPSAREHWSAMPPQVQQEVYRREAEMQRFVNDTHMARQVAERFYQTVQPHMATLQAEGVDAVTAVGNLMQFATRLRMGTPNEKASTIAALVKAYGVDVNALDSALVGQLPKDGPGSQPNVQQAVQQALQPIYQAAQQRQQMIQQQAAVGAHNEMAAFAQDKEFFQDLRGIMADLIEVAERQGYEMTLPEAYQRAALLHPEVSRVIIARQQGASARQLTANAQRARGAAVSVRGSAPVGGPSGAEPSSIRDSIEAAIESHSRL